MMDPLPTLLPPEIWTMIFQQLKRTETVNKVESLLSSDICNCYEVCCTFRDILRGSQICWLKRNSGVFKSIAPYLNGPAILRCRRVCKSWRRATDNCLEYNLRYFNSPRFPLACTFSTEKEIYNFLLSMQNHTGNPFPGRNVRLKYHLRPTSNKTLWIVAMTELLQKFGNSVRGLHLKLFVHCDGLEHLLYSCLDVLPNLRAFICEVYIRCQVILKIHTLPHLPFLECIRFHPSEYVRSEHIWLQKYVSSFYAPQLKQLELNFRHTLEHNLTHLPSLPVLEDLSLSVHRSSSLRYILAATRETTSRVLRRVSIKCSTQITLGLMKFSLRDILMSLDAFNSSLTDIKIICEMANPEVNWVTHEDLKSLGTYKSLKRLHIEGFWFRPGCLFYCVSPAIQVLHVNGLIHDWASLMNFKWRFSGTEENKIFGVILSCILLPKLHHITVHQTVTNLEDGNRNMGTYSVAPTDLVIQRDYRPTSHGPCGLCFNILITYFCGSIIFSFIWYFIVWSYRQLESVVSPS